jgi:hypothetical protein
MGAARASYRAALALQPAYSAKVNFNLAQLALAEDLPVSEALAPLLLALRLQPTLASGKDSAQLVRATVVEVADRLDSAGRHDEAQYLAPVQEGEAGEGGEGEQAREGAGAKGWTARGMAQKKAKAKWQRPPGAAQPAAADTASRGAAAVTGAAGGKPSSSSSPAAEAAAAGGATDGAADGAAAERRGHEAAVARQPAGINALLNYAHFEHDEAAAAALRGSLRQGGSTRTRTDTDTDTDKDTDTDSEKGKGAVSMGAAAAAGAEEARRGWAAAEALYGRALAQMAAQVG